jgi:hypothetical protein
VPLGSISFQALAAEARDRFLPRDKFLAARGISDLSAINRPTIKDFKAWRRARILVKKHAGGGRGVVLDAHPLRHRDTYAVDLLARGASPYHVAKLLGDTVEIVEKHCAPFVRELRERARRIMESGEGLEITGTQRAQQKQPEGKPS